LSRRRAGKNAKQKPPAAPPATAGQGGATSPAPCPASAYRPRRLRVWAFRLLAAVLAPTAVVLLLEGVLWVAGYGVPTTYFEEVPGRGAWTANARFGWRFFAPALARTPTLFSFPAAKAPGTYRIFVLGSSAARGTPEAAFSFARILEVMLREQYPAARFEVINTAMTAVNSHVMRLVAAECAEHGADLVVVYMGNNEVVGPYGPGTVYAGYLPSLPAIRASIFVRGTRTGQLVGRLLGALGGRPAGRWQGMEAFEGRNVPADDERLERVYDRFGANLLDICRLNRNAGAQVVLCTVGTNLRDCAPFASEHRKGLATADRERFDALCKSAAGLEAAGEVGQAAEKLAAAQRIDECYAELHYRLGRCLLAGGQAGRAAEAREHLRRARDLDALRFRADTRINQTIRQVAAEEATRGVHLADFEKALADAPRPSGSPGAAAGPPPGGPGREWFYEHVHLTFEGNYELAAAVFRQVAPLLPVSIRPAAATPPATAQRCARLLVWTPYNQWKSANVMADMVARPPFTGQFDHAADLARRRAEVARLRSAITPDVLAATEDCYLAAIGKDGEDLILRDGLAEFLVVRKKYREAAGQWQAVADRLPDSAQIWSNLGVALDGMGQVDRAVAAYRKSLALWPEHTGGLRNLAAALASKGDRQEAEDCYRKVLAIDDDDALAHAGLGGMLALRKQYDQARQHLEQAARLAPGNPSIHEKLAELARREGKGQEATEHHARAVRAASQSR
jgi:tetratricopeptide (TPR) repeat protein